MRGDTFETDRTSESAFRRANETGLCRLAHDHVLPRAIAELNSSVPPELDRLIVRCLRKEPDRRWQNMKDIQVALAELSQEMETATVLTRRVATVKPARRAPVAAILAATGVLAAGGAGVWIWRSQQAPAVPPAPAPVAAPAPVQEPPLVAPAKPADAAEAGFMVPPGKANNVGSSGAGGCACARRPGCPGERSGCER